jgi:hypothetical protein
MKNPFRLLLGVMLLLSACSSHQKKILVYANSPIQVDESQKNITVTEGISQVEKELDFSGSAPVVLNITGPSGHYTLEATDDGLWLANLKKDTIVGSMQHIGQKQQDRITQEQLKIQLDSLKMLIQGTNITPAAKNYFILPGTIAKITDKINAKIFGPFTSIAHDYDAGAVPETYKFYNLSEENIIIAKLTEMSKYKYENGEVKGMVDDPKDDSVYTIHPTKK